MNYYQKRFQQIISYDEIRIGKILEIVQFSFVFTILALIASYGVNTYILFEHNESESILQLLISLSIELALLTIIVFYLRKITLTVPSVAAMLFSNFKPYTTIDLGMWMILVFVFIGGISKINDEISLLNRKFDKLLKNIL
jgi:hypothetical protein